MSFLFRDLHPQVAIGTATDRYAGWVGQIYTPGRYAGHITRRTHEVGGRAFVEEVLPVASVEEYFEHFGVLELDATFYRPLLDEHLHPTETFHLLRDVRRSPEGGRSRHPQGAAGGRRAAPAPAGRLCRQPRLPRRRPVHAPLLRPGRQAAPRAPRRHHLRAGVPARRRARPRGGRGGGSRAVPQAHPRRPALPPGAADGGLPGAAALRRAGAARGRAGALALDVAAVARRAVLPCGGAVLQRGRRGADPPADAARDALRGLVCEGLPLRPPGGGDALGADARRDGGDHAQGHRRAGVTSRSSSTTAPAATRR